jgi:transcriptional regulator with XRE-family HTH domain
MRFKKLAGKDLPVIIQTGISQSTLSTWRKEGTYPRADDAVRIARALNTSVEYLVTGSDSVQSPYSQQSLEIADLADKLTCDGQNVLLAVARGLTTQFPQPGARA